MSITFSMCQKFTNAGKYNHWTLYKDHYTGLQNGDSDATNNTSESINKRKKNIHAVFQLSSN